MPLATLPDSYLTIHRLLTLWTERLGVTLHRVQIRSMRNKWGSISTAGTLTLSADLCDLPDELVEYVIVHELLHLRFPNHRRGWRVSMGIYLPNWRDREARLARHSSLHPPSAMIGDEESHKFSDHSMLLG